MDPIFTQTVKCGWRSCAQQFGSEIDMNMHVLMNHLMILEHGEFTLKKRALNRKRPGEPIPHAPAQFRPPPVQIVNPTPEIRVPPPEMQKPTVLLRPPETSRVPDHIVPRVIMPVLPPRAPAPAPSPVYNERGEKKPDLGDMIKLIREKCEFPSEAGTSGMSRHNEDMDVEEITMGKYYGGQHEQRKLSDVVDEFLERLKPMKQLGFIRPNKTVYCIVCLKYVRSFHECNWKHSPAEDRIVEMWFRRFGPEKPTGKNQLIGELMEVKAVIQAEEAGGTVHNSTL